MSIRPAKSGPGLSKFGAFALVTYLPEPLGSFLTELRTILPGDSFPEPHITFLPPRPLLVPAEAASDEIRQRLQLVKQFEIELGHIQMFSQTGIVYLSISDGYDSILNLHELLNVGNLYAQEDFEFIPHLTLGGPVDPVDSKCALQQADYQWRDSKLDRRFVVKEAVLLLQPCDGSDREWSRSTGVTLPGI